MHLRSFALLLFVLLVLSQAGLALWRYLPIEPSTAPVFAYPAAAEKFDSSPDLAQAVAIYNADRGGELKIDHPDGILLNVFYFEWDAFRIAPQMDIGVHTPEVCNVSSGFKLLNIADARKYERRDHPPLSFDTTVFSDRTGKTVFIFKIVWIQGRGAMAIREQTSHRIERIKNNFTRDTGAARVLQVGVFAARDIDHAWQVVCSEVLDKLEWRMGSF